MSFLYILQSQTNSRYYIGVSDSLDRRFIEHQHGQTPSTRGRGPWILVYTESYPTRTEALARERQLKSWKSHKALEQLIEENQQNQINQR
jgi:putative endonuclease